MLISVILIRRYLQGVYVNNKFILFDIQLLDVALLNHTVLKKNYTMYMLNIETPENSQTMQVIRIP